MGFETVAKATIRENIFNTVATLLNNNKLSGWTVLSSFPETNPTFPCLVVNPAKIKLKNLSVLQAKNKYDAEVMVNIYTLSKNGKEQSDEGADNVQNTLVSNASTLRTYNLALKEDSINDDDISGIEFNQEIINMRSISVNFGVRV